MVLPTCKNSMILLIQLTEFVGVKSMLGQGSMYSVHMRLDLVNMVVRPPFFTKSSLDNEENMKKGVGVYTLNIVFH